MSTFSRLMTLPLSVHVGVAGVGVGLFGELEPSQAGRGSARATAGGGRMLIPGPPRRLPGWPSPGGDTGEVPRQLVNASREVNRTLIDVCREKSRTLSSESDELALHKKQHRRPETEWRRVHYRAAYAAGEKVVPGS